MKEYLGEKIIQNLIPNFTTTDYTSTIVSKLSIMGAFKKFLSIKFIYQNVEFIYYFRRNY